MEKNKAALAKRKAALEQKKSAEATKPLPEGWKRVESRSRPGEFVYENTFTEERQAWFPEEPAEKPLPEGWRKVESRSYPGEFVYENEYTLDRVAWRPDAPASKTRAWRVLLGRGPRAVGCSIHAGPIFCTHPPLLCLSPLPLLFSGGAGARGAHVAAGQRAQERPRAQG